VAHRRDFAIGAGQLSELVALAADFRNLAGAGISAMDLSRMSGYP
jgi:hypothetical protein